MASLMIDREFEGVGRIQRRSGTDSAKMLSAYNAMLDSFDTAPRKVNLLRGIKDGHLKIGTVYEKFVAGELDNIVSVGQLVPAEKAIETWLDGNKELAKASIGTYRRHLAQVLKMKPGAVVSELPDALQLFRDNAYEHGHREMFKCAKQACLSFARSYGKDNPLAVALKKVEGFKHSSAKPRGSARSVVDVLRVVKAMRAPYGQQFWTCCMTGLRTAEMFEYGFTVHDNYVHIHGRKTPNADRRVPLMQSELQPPGVDEKAPQRALKEIEKDWQWYDARRSYSHWLEMARVPQSRISAYMGHRPLTQTADYQKHDPTAYFDEDADAFTAYIEKCIADVGKPKSKRNAPKSLI